MKYRNQVVLLAIVGAAFGVGRLTTGLEFSSTAQAQPDKKAPASAPAQPGMMDPTKMAMDAEHKVLDTLVGDWQGNVSMWDAPGGQPQANSGTIHREWVLNNHFVHETVNGGAMGPGMPAYQAFGVTGYNSDLKRYENGGVENASTGVQFSTGSYDAGKKTLTFTGDMFDHKQNKVVKMRSTLDCSNPDREVIAMWMPGPDGKDFKCFEGTFDRVKK